MRRLVQFFKKYYIILLFVLLEAGAISYYSDSTSYSRATLLATSNKITGGIRKSFASVGDYFTLRRDNRILLERLATTESELTAIKGYIASTAPAIDTARLRAALDSTQVLSVVEKYLFSTAKVISNSIARQDNFFIIDKGLRDGVEENMAVVSSDGSVAGYVRRCSDKYAVCMSVLNRDFRIGGKLKNSEYFGSIYWDGTNYREMVMSDVPRYASVSKGDTLLSVYSSRFPPDLFIGTVASVNESEDGTYHIIKIRLGAHMNALSDVLLVKYSDYAELDTLAGEHFPDSPGKAKR